MTNLQKNLVKQILYTLHFIAHMIVIQWKRLKSLILTQNIEKNEALCIVWFFDIL